MSDNTEKLARTPRSKKIQKKVEESPQCLTAKGNDNEAEELLTISLTSTSKFYFHIHAGFALTMHYTYLQCTA